MHTDNLQVGAIIQMLGERLIVLDRQIHPRFGLEFRIKRGRDRTPLWYSWRHVATWLASAEYIDNPT